MINEWEAVVAYEKFHPPTLAKKIKRFVLHVEPETRLRNLKALEPTEQKN